MTSVLTLQFTSLMQSFGTHSKSVYRDTDNMPTKSSVIGMILNAMGHDKTIDDEESKNMPKKWSEKLRFAVIQFSRKEPQKMTDFCIARRNDGKGNDLIHKDYIVDSKYKVFLEGEDGDIWLVAKSLLVPKRQLYIGRKCCSLHNPLCWDTDKPSITQNARIEEVMFKGINDTLFRETLPRHLIECGNVASYNKRNMSDDITSILNHCIGEEKWTSTFFIKKKTSPVRFGDRPFYNDLFCYKITYLRYGDLKEIESQ